VTLREYAERWLREHVAIACKPRTQEHYASVFKHHIYPALGNLALGDVTRERLRTLLAERAATGRTPKTKASKSEHLEPLSRATLTNILIPLRALLNSAVDDGKIASNPAVRLGRFSRGLNEREARKVEALTAEELARVLAVASKLYPDHADILHVLAWTGLRLGEACALQWEDIDGTGRFLEVRRTVGLRARLLLIGAPKSGQARRVDLPAALAVRLAERRSVQEAEAAVKGLDPSPWVFPSATDPSRPLNAQHLRFKVWYRVLRHAGLRGVRLHDLRHTYASLLLQAGEPIGYVKQQLGHSSIQVTVDRYGHFVPGANRSAVDRLAERTTPSNLDFSWTPNLSA
jgi:integrase